MNANTIPIVYFEDTSINDMLATLNKPIEYIGIVSNESFNDFFENIIDTYSVKQIHYLELNTSQNLGYFKELQHSTQDIELIYFNQTIKKYSYLPEPSYSNPIDLPYKYYNDFPNCSNQTKFSLHLFNQHNLSHRNSIVPNQLNARGSSNSFNRNRLNRNVFSLNFSYRNK